MSRECEAQLLPNCTIILDQKRFKYKQPKIGDTLGVDDSNDIMSSSHCCRTSAVLDRFNNHAGYISDKYKN